MDSQERRDDRLVRKVRAGQLLELYGALLTERQREYVRLHHGEDMSLGEIAAEFGVSRQAVHDAVRQAEAAMEQYESALGLLGRSAVESGQAAGEKPAESRARPAVTALAPVIEGLELLRNRLASQGIIYDAQEYARALDDLIERLRDLTGNAASEQ